MSKLDTVSDLSKKKCVPCTKGTQPLAQKEAENLLIKLGGKWIINSLGHLCKRYEFSNFITAMNFANKVAEIAEQEAHHPDIAISWGMCTIEIWSHKVNGLTESDFILAAKIDNP